MEKLSKLSFENSALTMILDKNNMPWFVASEICEIIGISNPSRAMEKIDPEDKLLYRIDISGQIRDTWCTNECGLYTLILSSSKPGAKKFKRWVVSELIPNARIAGIHSQDSMLSKAKELSALSKRFDDNSLQIIELKQKVRDLTDENNQITARMKEIITSQSTQLSLFFPEPDNNNLNIDGAITETTSKSQ